MSKDPAQNGSEQRDDLLLRFVLGELSPREASAFERRLVRDPEFAEEARQLARSYQLLGHAALEEPPPGLRARVLGAASRARAAQPTPGRWMRRAALAAAAASVLVVVGLGIDDLRLRRELALLREVTETLQQPNVVVSFALRGTGQAAGAYGRAVLDLDAQKAALVVHGLPALPEDRAYWLWALVGDEAVPCGRFVRGSDDRIVRQFAIPVEQYTEPVRRLIVTIEPAAEAREPRGPTVLSST